jgi:hypothetical protein
MSGKTLLFLAIVFTSMADVIAQDQPCPGSPFRAPAVPLVTHDPYFSIWSGADKITDAETMHWTGRNHPLHSIVRIDGQSFRLMGSRPTGLEPLMQVKVNITPTRTIYTFNNQQVQVELSFFSPVLPSKLDLFARPVSYIKWEIRSTDGKSHDVQLYMDAGGEIAVNDPEQSIKWDSPEIDGLSTTRWGNPDQPVLEKKGDNLRIDWGYAYLSVPSEQMAETGSGPRDQMHKAFINEGQLAVSDNLLQPRKANDGYFVMAVAWDLESVGSLTTSRWVMLSYDDLYSIRYFKTDLRPWWRRNGQSMGQLLAVAEKEYDELLIECRTFDKDLMRDLEASGGTKYAAASALVFRQCVAAHKLVADPAGMPLLFPKENFSNGCIATVDVIYPASPFFLLFSPALTKAMLQPVLAYASSPRWKFDFAPHDLGTYPKATGQVYGAGEASEEDQMPVEETGNMLIMTAALARMEGNAHFAERYWPLLQKWAAYLVSKGFDPENQLCTDDFAGHLAHNVNLSAKAIEALASYAFLCEMKGDKDEAATIRSLCTRFAGDWITQSADGDHTRLAFDLPGTWSQKYNLVWDKVLGFNLFPDSLVQKELIYYKKIQARYGLPLDSRERYTKNDWITWTASLSDSREDFETLFNPVYEFACKTPQRVPMTDWYVTDNAYCVGFRARSVVGGFYMKLLRDQETWKKWFARGENIKGEWSVIAE